MKHNFFTGLINENGHIASFNGKLWKVKKSNMNSLTQNNRLGTRGLIVVFTPQPCGRKWRGVPWAASVVPKSGRCEKCGNKADRLYWIKNKKAICLECLI